MTHLARSTALVLLTLVGLALVWLFREPILIFLVALFLAASLRPVSYTHLTLPTSDLV